MHGTEVATSATGTLEEPTVPVASEPGSVPPPHAGPGRCAVADVLSGVEALRVHLQPIVDLATGQVWGVEALARFPGHPQPGPAAWFEAALADGRGPALERVALRGALAVLPLLPQHLRLTVNLSAQALLDPQVQQVLLAQADARVLVELTEHEPVTDYPAVAAVLATLSAAGIGLGIDDVGAGCSSLRHVLHLEPDIVKLDLSLVQGVGTCCRRRALVQAMVGFVSTTGALLVAEGVEEGDDLLALVDLGVGHAQGWFLARPAEPAVVLPVLVRPQAVVGILA